jgi:uncharacterized protein YraI
MTKLNRIIASALTICFTALACNLPAGGATTAPESDASPTFTPIVAQADNPTPTPTNTVAPTACSPIVTTTTDANVRGGPGQVYNIYGVIPLGGTAPLAGKSADGAWWYIGFAAGAGGYGWISGSITTASCTPGTLAIIAAPPTPTLAPTSTPTPTQTPSLTPTPTPTFTPTPTPTIIFVPPVFPTIHIPCVFC